MPGKLFIYDTLDEDNKEQAESRFDDDDDITALPCGSKTELLSNLDRLLKAGRIFDRVLFQTHGHAGAAVVGESALNWTFFGVEIRGGGYDGLFPSYTRIYFDGCNVGANDTATEGDDLLEAVGNTLLVKGGGEVFAWTSPGYVLSPWLAVVFPAASLFANAHTRHFSGSCKTFYFAPGGKRTWDP